jgi:hypothetical protein
MKGQKSGKSHSILQRDTQSAQLGHELCNVLNGLLGMIERLGESGLSDKQNQWLKAIEHSGLQMQSLIRPDRFPGQVSGISLKPRIRRVDGVQMLEQVLTSHIPAAQSRKNTLFMMIAPDLPRHWDCDPCMVRQLLDNVLGNAIKFTAAGNVLVEVMAGPATRTLLFRISDTGPGIGNTWRKPTCVAEPASPEPGRTGFGNQGLGLQICRRILAALGGRLNCGSPGSGGTCIEISLPHVLADSTGPAGLGCSLFDSIRCRLRLAEPWLKCAGSILDRLGVEWTGDPQVYSDQNLCIDISEAARGPGYGRGVLLLPMPADKPGHGGKSIAMPLLESSLGALLLEMALEWHGRNISCDIADSAPQQRR